ncbi:NHL repeat domain-containing protein [Ditylenchus destructor]|nr:NHL repeat domain-containing protein [Ditylenchus destructor]
MMSRTVSKPGVNLFALAGYILFLLVSVRGQEQAKLADLFKVGQEQQQQWPAYGMYYEPNNGGMSPVLGEENAAAFDLQPELHQQQNFDDLSNLEDESSFFELAPTIGQTAGLAIDSQNNLVLFHRSARVWDQYSFTKDNRLNKTLGAIPNATIAILDPNTGKLISEHGQNEFYMPHGLTIDSEGNYWVTDVGSHQIIKLDKSFKPVMTLGEKLVPGSDDKHFCKPTDVAVAKNGDFFVADGYCNSRIMKFNKEGKLIASFGSQNSANPPQVGEFFVPHSLALIEDLNLLCVADRENRRIQCFAAGLSEGQHFHPRAFVPTGTFFTKAENIGRVFAIREKQHYLVGVTDHDETDVEPQVFVMDMNTGRANTFAKGLENAHALALNDFGDIFISQMNPNQIVKFSVPEEL